MIVVHVVVRSLHYLSREADAWALLIYYQSAVSYRTQSVPKRCPIPAGFTPDYRDGKGKPNGTRIQQKQPVAHIVAVEA